MARRPTAWRSAASPLNKRSDRGAAQQRGNSEAPALMRLAASYWTTPM